MGFTARIFLYPFGSKDPNLGLRNICCDWLNRKLCMSCYEIHGNAAGQEQLKHEIVGAFLISAIKTQEAQMDLFASACSCVIHLPLLGSCKQLASE